MVFFFNDTATTEIYTLSLHDALPIYDVGDARFDAHRAQPGLHCHHAPFSRSLSPSTAPRDRKSTRLNSSHQIISYAVFCLKKKNNAIDRLHQEFKRRSKTQPVLPTAR